MKLRKLLWIGVFVLPLFACDDPDKTVENTSTLEFLIPIHSAEANANESHDFSGFATFSLTNKDNAQNSPSNILRVMQGNGSKLTLPAISGEIKSMQLVWGYAEIDSDNFEMQSSIELLSQGAAKSTQQMVISLDQALMPLIDKIDSNPNTYIKVMVTGNADSAISSMAKLEIPIVVEHEVLEVRFSVL
jgi:hypothetical protein